MGALLGLILIAAIGLFSYRSCFEFDELGKSTVTNKSIRELNKEESLRLPILLDQIKTQSKIVSRFIIIGSSFSFAFVLVACILLNMELQRLEKSQNDFKSQSELLQTILNFMADGVVVADLHGKFIVYNPSAERILGFGKDESTPDHWSETIGMFESDGTTTAATAKLPLVRALKGETENLETFLKNKKHPEGVHIRMAGKP